MFRLRGRSRSGRNRTCASGIMTPSAATWSGSAAGGTRTRTPCVGHRALNPARLPFHHSRLARESGIEPDEARFGISLAAIATPA